MQSRKSNSPAAAVLGHLEISVMNVLWEHGECNVHDVVPRLPRPLAYTTVMTTLDRLFKKGLLDRKKADRAFFYSAKFTRREWDRERAGHLVADFLAGPHPAGDLLISCLVDAVSPRDASLLDELERKIREKRLALERGAE